MVRVICLFAISFLMFQNIFAQQYGSFKDSRDGKVYKTVKIGGQEWMAENLNVSKFRNGDPIPEAKSDEEWEKAGRNKQPVWCYYDNEPINGKKYGKLYNWYAVIDPRGLAPVGYHIPKKKELELFIEYLGSDKTISAKKIKSREGWKSNGNGTNGNGSNESGFSAFPAGYRYRLGTFFQIGETTGWWSSSTPDWAHGRKGLTDIAVTYGVGLGISENFGGVSGNDMTKGLSVRCIKE